MAAGDTVAVLGVDLGVRWESTGSALLSFRPGGGWVDAVPGAIPWPSERECTAAAVAGEIDGFARSQGITAISLDGPQGWRAPGVQGRQGVGRWCE